MSHLLPLLCRICNKCPPLIACVMTALNPCWVCCQGKRGLLRWKPESTVKRGNCPEKKIIIKKISFCEKSTSYDPPFSPSLSELNSHILTLSIYLYSHLFTFLFKIFVYKCVYKLKIISFCPVSKWHLQGQGVCGIEVSHCITRAYKEAAPNTV